MRTRRSVCERKRHFPCAEEARHAAQRDALPLRAYRCDRCGHHHLTSRTKGKWVTAGRHERPDL